MDVSHREKKTYYIHALIIVVDCLDQRRWKGKKISEVKIEWNRDGNRDWNRDQNRVYTKKGLNPCYLGVYTMNFIFDRSEPIMCTCYTETDVVQNSW